MICLPLQASYIRIIILEIATFFTYLPVELITETSQFGFKDLGFSTREVLKFKTVKASVCLAKDFRSFLVKYLFVELYTSSFFFFFVF